jgi:prophage regulatory protein
MPRVQARNTTTPNMSDMKNDDPSFPSSSPQTITTRLYPQQSSGTRQRENTIVIDEQIFLRLPKVIVLTGLSKSTLYAMIQQEGFPSSILLGRRTVAWLKSEVEQWISERIQASRQARSGRWASSPLSRL